MTSNFNGVLFFFINIKNVFVGRKQSYVISKRERTGIRKHSCHTNH